MKLRTIFAAAALTALFASAPVVAHAAYGDWDAHHVWHDAPWWYHHHPDWVWYHHPEWIQVYPDWRPFYGDWDEHHVWHERDWWFAHRPDWVRAHHHDWVRWHR